MEQSAQRSEGGSQFGEDATPVIGVQSAPQVVKLDEADHLRYQLLGSRVNEAQLKIAMYQRELQHAQIELAKLTPQVAEHVRYIEGKYQTDLTQNRVSEDGYLMPRPRDERQLLQR